MPRAWLLFLIVIYGLGINAAVRAAALTSPAFDETDLLDTPTLTEENNPGIVLVYREEEEDFTVATPKNVNTKRNSYVLIMGAYCQSTFKQTGLELAQALRFRDRDSNIFLIDWSYYSGFDAGVIKDVVRKEVSRSLDNIAEAAARMLLEDEPTADFSAVLERQIKTTAKNVALAFIPVHQANYIPEVARRAAENLFEASGTECLSQTYDRVNRTERRFVFSALGLDPKDVTFIGHSHGAHVCGLVGMNANRKYGQVKRIAALEPSPEICHRHADNFEGTGWNQSAAKFVDVYRTSEFLCADRIYGNVNVFFADSEHRTMLNALRSKEINDPAEFLSLSVRFFKNEIAQHSFAIETFIALVEEDANFLRADSAKCLPYFPKKAVGFYEVLYSR